MPFACDRKLPIGIQSFEKLRREGYVYVFELKLDGSAEAALDQIDRRGYARPYEADSRVVSGKLV